MEQDACHCLLRSDLSWEEGPSPPSGPRSLCVVSSCQHPCLPSPTFFICFETGWEAACWDQAPEGSVPGPGPPAALLYSSLPWDTQKALSLEWIPGPHSGFLFWQQNTGLWSHELPLTGVRAREGEQIRKP